MEVRIGMTAASGDNHPGIGHGHEALPHDEVVVVVDFGSQTSQLIARRVREAGAFSVLVSPGVTIEELGRIGPKGIILSGGPASIHQAGAPRCDPGVLELGVPVLGICYGMQLACSFLGAEVRRGGGGPGRGGEYGRAGLTIKDRSDLFGAIPEKTAVWMSHNDQVVLGPADGRSTVLASTDGCELAGVRIRREGKADFFGVQFHPEVTHTPHGVDILQNFLYSVCGCGASWKMSDYKDVAIDRVREQVAGGRVICGLSGGVDSSVCAALLHEAIGDRLHCIFVDTGLLRKNERELVETTFRDHSSIDLTVVDASEAFLGDLAGITDPQVKRKRIGNRFVRVFEQAAGAVAIKHGGDAKFLAQGTLYPDVIESGHGHAGTSASIKLHHNVGGLPDDLNFQLVEPLRDLFKDEVRKLGSVLGLPDAVVWRHPFPGPGLAVRILGEVTRDKLAVLRDCDEILLEEIVGANLYKSTSQVFAVLPGVRSVGVMGDGRTYEELVAIRAVETQDFMTADWCRLPYEVLGEISTRIINEVQGVNRVVYDISSKPPATIEWE